jgi:hypothetical protein
MINEWVQTAAVVALVGGCGFVVVRKAWRTLAGKGGGSCGCENCPVGNKAKQPPTSQNSKQPTTFFNPLNNITLEKSPTSHKPKIRLMG